MIQTGDSQEKWLSELITHDLTLHYSVKNVIYSGRSAFQQIDIFETETLGRSLVLDGKTQSTETDEHMYHEALVHPSMSFHDSPKSVFVGGGGEGATLREVLAYSTVERVVMVDLDPQVVKLCREFLPNHSDGAFDDSRVELYHEDARNYLEGCEDSFDVIILDLVDPLEAGTAYKLYTREFYEIVRSKLNPHGLMVTQSGPASLLNYTECFTAIINTIGGVFPQAIPYTAYIPSFVTLWGFTIASVDDQPRIYDSPNVDGVIADRLVNESVGLKLVTL